MFNISCPIRKKYDKTRKITKGLNFTDILVNRFFLDL